MEMTREGKIRRLQPPRKAILIEDSESNDDSQIAPMDAPPDVGYALVSEPTNIYKAFRASGIDYLWHLLLLLRRPCI